LPFKNIKLSTSIARLLPEAHSGSVARASWGESDDSPSSRASPEGNEKTEHAQLKGKSA
jgi:hypothetical protein